MKDNEFDIFIKNSLIDEDDLKPEKALIETTKNLIKKQRKRDLLMNKIYVLILSIICLLFSIKAINLSIKSGNVIVINSLILGLIATIILNFIYRHEIIAFLKIKGE
ncbi:hypothetical protein [Faecalimicrobium dakarense]|uniref:hypothetical protein n=1 Tax=Faecalimicrobium dakarense TaxID=1301100 RepID=UPI0004B3E56D|nr:hypothetical protein [[Clostridium] dakarense]